MYRAVDLSSRIPSFPSSNPHLATFHPSFLLVGYKSLSPAISNISPSLPTRNANHYMDIYPPPLPLQFHCSRIYAAIQSHLIAAKNV